SHPSEGGAVHARPIPPPRLPPARPPKARLRRDRTRLRPPKARLPQQPHPRHHRWHRPPVGGPPAQGAGAPVGRPPTPQAAAVLPEESGPSAGSPVFEAAGRILRHSHRGWGCQRSRRGTASQAVVSRVAESQATSRPSSTASTCWAAVTAV